MKSTRTGERKSYEMWYENIPRIPYLFKNWERLSTNKGHMRFEHVTVTQTIEHKKLCLAIKGNHA